MPAQKKGRQDGGGVAETKEQGSLFGDLEQTKSHFVRLSWRIRASLPDQKAVNKVDRHYVTFRGSERRRTEHKEKGKTLTCRLTVSFLVFALASESHRRLQESKVSE